MDSDLDEEPRKGTRHMMLGAICEEPGSGGAGMKPRQRSGLPLVGGGRRSLSCCHCPRKYYNMCRIAVMPGYRVREDKLRGRYPWVRKEKEMRERYDLRQREEYEWSLPSLFRQYFSLTRRAAKGDLPTLKETLEERACKPKDLLMTPKFISPHNHLDPARQ